MLSWLFQSFKRKPGQADNERSTGDYNERINKRLRTVESTTEKTLENKPTQAQQESDLYEHIKQGETAYDTQTYGQAPITPQSRYAIPVHPPKKMIVQDKKPLLLSSYKSPFTEPLVSAVNRCCQCRPAETRQSPTR